MRPFFQGFGIVGWIVFGQFAPTWLVSKWFGIPLHEAGMRLWMGFLAIVVTFVVVPGMAVCIVPERWLLKFLRNDVEVRE